MKGRKNFKMKKNLCTKNYLCDEVKKLDIVNVVEEKLPFDIFDLEDKNLTENQIIDGDTYNLIKNIKNFSENITEKIKLTTEAIKDVDEKISDLLHYIEFNQLNARDGYNAARMVQARSKDRTNLLKYRSCLSDIQIKIEADKDKFEPVFDKLMDKEVKVVK